MIYQEIRPKTFDKMYGNSVRIIENDLKNNTLSHAMLLFGEHGVGKTSSAYALAESLPNCKVIEINAASESTKKDSEKVIASANSLGIGIQHKIILIEEAHKSSPGFQSALLRPLENPKEGIIFILTTTEPNKIIPTIRSRCKEIKFSCLSKKEIENLLTDGRKVCKVKTELPSNVVDLIYKKTGGHARDALTELEHIASVENEAEMLEILQVIKKEEDPKISDLFWSLYNWEGRKASITKLNTLRDENPESIRRVLLAIADKQLLKLPDTIEGDEDAQVIYRLVRCFNKKDVFTDYHDLVDSVLSFMECNKLWKEEEN